MSAAFSLPELLQLSKEEQYNRLTSANEHLETLTAAQRFEWARENLGGELAVSSSFGIQSAVMLHLGTRCQADMKVILTDTGYLFPETYRFIDDLERQLKFDLRVYRAEECAAWQEARFGKLWQQGIEGIEKYNKINKVEPMLRALKDLNVTTWFAGLRRGQASSRNKLPILGIQNGVFKFLPIADWTDDDVDAYLKENSLPYHPLKAEGYVSVGDVHTTQKWKPGMDKEKTRFFGLKRECGLHEGSYVPPSSDDKASPASPAQPGDKDVTYVGGRCRVPSEFLPFRVNWQMKGAPVA
eukprot:Rhum_TRINITY_DN3327_c0_g1::Rhum_TRINITY_DN3327_c0_g1_i1::g.10408::m.10408/K00390/cysH; phosphoadenosine phosphosulfate reductase